MTFKRPLWHMPAAAPLKMRANIGVTAAALLLCALIGSGRVGATTPSSAASMPPRLTQAQWDALFKAADKRITSLRLRAIIRLRSYTTKSQAEWLNKQMRKALSPKAWQFYKHKYGSVPGHGAAGYGVQLMEVQLDWNVPERLINARTIQFGVQTLGLGGEVRKSPRITIWVAGRRLEWHATFFHGIWAVSLYKRNSAWARQRWSNWWTASGSADIAYARSPFAASFSRGTRGTKTGHFHISSHLIRQKYDPSSGIIQLVYELFHKRKPLAIFRGGLHGRVEVYYNLKLAGGLRLYRKAVEVVYGFQRVLKSEFDFRRFRKSGGVWFSTRIRDRAWGGKEFKRLEQDETIKISHLAVNRIFPPGRFQYTPPFGATVYDGRTNKTYVVGLNNPGVPPAAPGEGAGGKKGSDAGK